jgi:hypothetical protein
VSDYSQKCIARLEELGAPLYGWVCVDVVDLGSAEFTCELCGYDPIRYVHIMVHSEWQGVFRVGCVCDGTMSGDMLAAKHRDRAARLKSSRKSAFLKKQWKEHSAGYMVLNTRIRIIAEKDSFSGREFYKVTVGGEQYQWWNNRRVESLAEAKLLAFEVLEHERETDRAEI